MKSAASNACAMIACPPPQIIAVATPRTLALDLAALPTCPPDMVEYRADLADSLSAERIREDLMALHAAAQRPLICTLRDAAEGGECRLPLEQRAALLRAALPFVAGLDIELANLPLREMLRADLAQRNVACILSWHDFAATPPDAVLHEKLAAARAALPADGIVKVATHCATAADALRLLALPQAAPTLRVAVVGMGPLGRAVRMVAPAFGSVLGYAALTQAVAPGQLSVAETRAAWRVLERGA
jgi:3-dehydroquinate dehydratase-1